MDRTTPRGALAALCITEIISWGVLYYAFPVLAPAITADTGWSAATATGAFSAALVMAALGGIPVGRLLDRDGPRAVMTAGAAMSAVLCPPAFAAITRHHQPHHVPALITLTLVAGPASTVFAPLTDALGAHLSWRGVYLVPAVLLAVVTIPLHAVALRRPCSRPPPVPIRPAAPARGGRCPGWGGPGRSS